jgi:putative addiction module component (TIGR02574 family)
MHYTARKLRSGMSLLHRHHQVLHDVNLPFGVGWPCEGKSAGCRPSARIPPGSGWVAPCVVGSTEYVYLVALTNLATAEEGLSLSPAERADLARLLIQSLEDDSRTDAEIKDDLARRLEDLVSGKDSGLTFKEVFGSPL